MLVKESVRHRQVKGAVPAIDVLAQKISNKKMTTITGLELY